MAKISSASSGITKTPYDIENFITLDKVTILDGNIDDKNTSNIKSICSNLSKTVLTVDDRVIIEDKEYTLAEILLVKSSTFVSTLGSRKMKNEIEDPIIILLIKTESGEYKKLFWNMHFLSIRVVLDIDDKVDTVKAYASDITDMGFDCDVRCDINKFFDSSKNDIYTKREYYINMKYKPNDDINTFELLDDFITFNNRMETMGFANTSSPNIEIGKSIISFSISYKFIEKFK